MGKGTTMFGNFQVEKHRFYQQKRPIFIHYVNIDRIVVSSKDRFSKEGFKYFIGYEGDFKTIFMYNGSKYECTQNRF